jgi:hypothetical protein
MPNSPPTNLTPAKPHPLHRRHDSLFSTNHTNQPTTQKPTASKPLAPQSLTNTFPSSRRPRARYSSTSTHNPTPSSPLKHHHQQQEQHHQSRLHAALTHLSRAAALLPQHPTTATASEESLYLFASPTWSREMWVAEVQRAKREFAEKTAGAGGPGVWVERAVEVLKREGEEGEFWKDGRDLEELWGRGGV